VDVNTGTDLAGRPLKLAVPTSREEAPGGKAPIGGNEKEHRQELSPEYR